MLQWGALVAATPVVATVADTSRAYGLTRSVAQNPALPINLELVTLTETSAVITWFTGDPTRPDRFGRLAPMPADTEVLLGTSRGSLKTIHHDTRPSPYHYVEIRGLEPGQSYVCVAQSNGVAALPSAANLGNPVGTSALRGANTSLVFSTPQPPPGRHLFTVALCNDLHLGEKTAGLLTTQAGIGLPPGIEQVPGKRPYPEIMAAALAKETRERGADLLLAAGDISSEAAQVDVRNAKHFLDQFGQYRSDYFVARGNHDRPHAGDTTKGCSPYPHSATLHDCFHDTFDPGAPAWFTAEKFGMRIVGIDTYDTTGSGRDSSLSNAQMTFLGRELFRDKDRPTLVFGHHPVVLDATTNALPPVAYGMKPAQARQLTAWYKHTPGVFLHHAGHTHRNKRAVSLAAPGVVFQEVSATKEYPGGFTLVRIHEGGYAMNFYKFRDLAAQEWSERSRPEYLGAAPSYTLGNAADRNAVVHRDFSGLQRAK
ncbi:MAG: 3,5-cyclic-AMP phosphodiesterase [Actinomycetota bacterium]|jgi:hypothetical protein